jgi:pyruvate formate lyase activating enzyme
MNERRRPLVAEVKRNSLDDGPGIRSVVFFKGCPLSCLWCHNPECISAAPEIMFQTEKCIESRDCVKACTEGAIGSGGPAALDRRRCNFCGRCVDECPSSSFTIVGRYYEPDTLVDLLCEDRAFFDNSGGGVTLSGGEPTVFMKYAAEVARRLRQRSIHVLLESCGDFPWDRFETTLLPHVDTVYIDLKIESEEGHRRFTGRGNDRIKSNIDRLLARRSVEMLVRIPLVPEITATRENLEGIAAWLAARDVESVALMPYNPLWIAKAKALGKSPAYSRETCMTADERQAVKQIFAGFRIVRDF